jgi:Cdc6-like AAA superfamily ATPase
MPALTRLFVDRTDEIDQLNAALNSESPEKDSCILVYGQTGIGKTQLLAKYLRECNYKSIRIAHVDLEEFITKGYLGLIEAIVEGLGSNGFERLDETYDEILIRPPIERSMAFTEEMPARAAAPAQGFVFHQAVTAQQQTFIHGDVTYHNPKIENIYNIHLAEPEKVAELIQNRITRIFRNCLQTISREQLVVILLDHWETTSDPIKSWLDDHLLKWIAELTLRKAIVVVAREVLPRELEDQVGVLPIAIPPFNREIALEFWKKNGLAEEGFNTIASEIYSIPGIFSLEVGKQRLKQAKG